jgi:hypothetical protein
VSKKETTSTVNVDPATQAYQNEHLRPGAVQAADAMRALPGFNPDSYMAFMNPYQREVIDGAHADFDRQREFAMDQGASAATSAGAFGGSRSGILQASLVDGVNRNEASTIAGIRSAGYGQANQLAMAMDQAQRAGLLAPMQALQLGLGVPGQSQTTPGSGFGGWVQGAAGLGLAAGGMGFNPFGKKE